MSRSDFVRGRGFAGNLGWRPEPPRKQESNGAESLRNQGEAAEQEQESQGPGCDYDGEAARAGGGGSEKIG